MRYSKLVQMEARHIILLVEDNASDIWHFRKVARQANLVNHIHVVETGEEAIRYLAGEGKYSNRDKFPMPVLVFLDLKLPRISGFGVLKWIEANILPAESRVVVLAGVADNLKQVKEAYKLGAQTFLVKPLTKPDFVNSLNGVRGIRLVRVDTGLYVDAA
ncbi:MAG: response regulator [Verrucomicrobiales bacterium]|nr:response regulator [Verrucomicrobiales bacterium]